MIKRGSAGNAGVSESLEAPTPAEEAPQGQALDILEMAIAEAEKTKPLTEVAPESVPEPSPEPPTPTTEPAPAPDPLAEGVMTQALPQAIQETADALDPALTAPVSTQKEVLERSASLDQIAADLATGIQVVEQEKNPEIPPEVESYLQKVEENTDSAPPEIVIADGSAPTAANRAYPSQPVVVLPITAEEEKAGAQKSPQFSLRWLVEWSRRLMKVFAGKIIYKPAEEGAT